MKHVDGAAEWGTHFGGVSAKQNKSAAADTDRHLREETNNA